MNKRFPHVARGQTALEYLLLLGLVAFVTFAAFTSNGFMSKVKDSSTDYFTKIGRVIQGENPTTPITGKWCEWSLCTNYIQFRTCECPAPAFGVLVKQAPIGNTAEAVACQRVVLANGVI